MNTSWIPVRQDRSADDIPPQWVRSQDIIDVDKSPTRDAVSEGSDAS
ncbi:hypothetical protein ILP97_37260 [Amycolatopsis sp. H6(2020)]|nr:hypothetical protein [Amycolatopsis sp. H6(2020)]